LRLVRAYVPNGARVLDIGSGTGFYLDRWREAGAAAITGSDLTTAAISSLSQRYSVPLVQLDIGESAIPLRGPFDAISAIDVLFHIVDDARYRQALRNLAALLAPNGVLIFTDNCLHGEALRSTVQVSRTLSEIAADVRAAGMRIVERRPAFVLMNTPVDSTSKALQRYWALVRRIAAKHALAGEAAGAALYGPELLLTRIVREGPSTEYVVCRHATSCA
jgi:SAM-dependent methyltransferase